MARSIQKNGVEVRAVFQVFDINDAVVTGLVNANFTKAVYKDGAASGVASTVTEISGGSYYISFTPNATGNWQLWWLHSTHNPRGWNEDFDVVTRAQDDLAFPNTSGRGMDVDASGGVEVGSFQAGAITAAAIADGAIDAATFAAGAIDASAIASNAITAAKIAADAIGASQLAADAVTEIQSGLATSAALATVQSDTDNIQTRIPAALVSGRMDSSVGAMAADTLTASALAADAVTEIQAGLAVPGSAMALTSGERDSVASALLDLANGVETSYTVRQVLRLVSAMLLGKASGGAGSSVFRDIGDTKNRVTTVADSNGNRTTMTLDAS